MLRDRLLDREDELDRLVTSLGMTRTGSSRLMVVEADPGCGKSALLAESARCAETAGFRVLRARGIEFETSLQFGVVRRLFAKVPEDVLDRAPASTRDVLSSSGSAVPGDDQHAALFSLYALCEELASSSPVLLVIDDLHWADDASVKFVGFLRERFEDLHLAVLLGTRPVEAAASPTALAVVNDPRSELVRLTGLSPGATADFLRATSGELADDVCRAAHQATGGNPFYLQCIIAELGHRADLSADDVARLVPDAAIRALLARISTMPAPALPVARAVAVLGEDAEPRFVAALAGITATDAIRAADALQAEGVLSTSRPLEFRHPIMRAAVLGGMRVGEVSLERRRAAEILADNGVAPIRVALQLLETEPLADSWVVDQLERGARSLRGAGRQSTAVALLTRALAEPPSSERLPFVLADLGTAERHVLAPAATHHLARALPLLPRTQGLAATVVFELAAAYEATGQLAPAVALLDKVLDVSLGEPGRLSEIENTLLSCFASGMRIIGLMPPVASQVREAAATLATLDPSSRTARVIAATIGPDLCVRGTGVGDAAEVLRIGRIAIASGLPPADLALPLTYGILSAMIAAGDPRAALDAVEAGAVARVTGSPWAAAVVSIYHGYAHLELGELADAEADLAEAISVFDGGTPTGVAATAGFHALVDLERRGPAAARETLERFRAQADQVAVIQSCWYRGADAVVGLAEGDPLAAAAAARRTGDALGMAAMSAPSMFPWRSHLASAELALGRVRSARSLITEQVELCRAFGAPAALADALVVQASAAHEPSTARALLDEAVTLAVGHPLSLVRALSTLGLHQVAHEDLAAARESLRRSYDIADRIGATWRRNRIGEHLLGVGVRVAEPVAPGRTHLTPSELRTCRLAADGLTNREIAQTLFVSMKTVETHLRAAFRKLGIATRQELTSSLLDATPAA